MNEKLRDLIFFKLAVDAGLFEWEDIENEVAPLPDAFLEAVLQFGILVRQHERQEIDQDAKRYRYLRNVRRRECLTLTGPEAGVWCDAEDEDGTLVLLTGTDLDYAIDDAMTRTE